MEIRRALKTDIPQLTVLWNKWHITAGELHPEMRVEDSAWIAADSDGGVIAWLQGHHRQNCIWRRIVGYEDEPEGWTCTYLSLMLVHPDHRLHGVGSGLLSAFEEDAREAGNSLVVLNPSTADGPTLNRFYERNGYSVRDGSRGHSTYLMAKDLG